MSGTKTCLGIPYKCNTNYGKDQEDSTGTPIRHGYHTLFLDALYLCPQNPALNSKRFTGIDCTYSIIFIPDYYTFIPNVT